MYVHICVYTHTHTHTHTRTHTRTHTHICMYKRLFQFFMLRGAKISAAVQGKEGRQERDRSAEVLVLSEGKKGTRHAEAVRDVGHAEAVTGCFLLCA
jgi:hypothetical protein